jgi:secreted PhoX family phosphatase
LALVDRPSTDTRNWNRSRTIAVGEPLAVQWVDLDQVTAPDDDLRRRGFDQGAARFARGEGIWFGTDELYFACTSGGVNKLGQIWRYRPRYDDQAGSAISGQLTLFIEPNDSNLIANADNLTVAPWGDLIVCEDRSGPVVRLVGVTPRGQCYAFALHHLSSEFAGVTFSPDGTTMFVNIMGPGLTLAITGPWRHQTA